MIKDYDTTMEKWILTISVSFIFLIILGGCSAGTVRSARAVPDDKVSRTPPDPSPWDSLPFNNKICPWGQLPHDVGNSTRCCQMESCGPGYEVQQCDWAGGQDKCVQCPPNYIQNNNVSSLNMEEAKCFMNNKDEFKKCTFQEQKPSGQLFSEVITLSCQCKWEDCFYKSDEWNCYKDYDGSCSVGQTMNRSTGACEDCPWGSYKDYVGCGPCFLNLTLISQGKPTSIDEVVTKSENVLSTTIVPSYPPTNKTVGPEDIPAIEAVKQAETDGSGFPTIIIYVVVPVVVIAAGIVVAIIIKRRPSCNPCNRATVFQSTISSLSNSSNSETGGEDDSQALLRNNNKPETITTGQKTTTTNGLMVELPSTNPPETRENVQYEQQSPDNCGNQNPTFIASRQNSTLDGSPTSNTSGSVFGQPSCQSCMSGPGNICLSGTFNNCDITINQNQTAVPNEPQDCTCETSVKTASRQNSEISVDSYNSGSHQSMSGTTTTELSLDSEGRKANRLNPYRSPSVDTSIQSNAQQSVDSFGAGVSGTSVGSNQSTGEGEDQGNSGNIDTCDDTSPENQHTSDRLISLKGDIIGNMVNKIPSLGESSDQGRPLGDVSPVTQGQVLSRITEKQKDQTNIKPRSPVIATVRPSQAQHGERKVAEVRPMTTSGHFAGSEPRRENSNSTSLSYMILHNDPHYDTGVMDRAAALSDFTESGGSPLNSDGLYAGCPGTRLEPDGEEVMDELEQTFVKQRFNDNDETFVKCVDGEVTVAKAVSPTVLPADDTPPKHVALRADGGSSGGGGNGEQGSSPDLGHNPVFRTGAGMTSYSLGPPALSGNGAQEMISMDGERHGSQTVDAVASPDNYVIDNTPQHLNQMNSGLSGESFEIDPRDLCDDEDSDESFELTSVNLTSL